jgi:hypothetical protein
VQTDKIRAGERLQYPVASCGTVVRVLLEYGTNVDAEDDDGKTTNQVVSESVNANAWDAKGLQDSTTFCVGTSLAELAPSLSVVVQLLPEHGADVNAQGIYRFPPVAYSGTIWER